MDNLAKKNQKYIMTRITIVQSQTEHRLRANGQLELQNLLSMFVLHVLLSCLFFTHVAHKMCCCSQAASKIKIDLLVVAGEN